MPSKHSFLDSILNRPSQSYSGPEPGQRSGSSMGWAAPADLPNRPQGANSILAGNMFKAKGKGSLAGGSQFGSTYAPSDSGSTIGGRSSIFGRKKKKKTAGSVIDDGASSVAASTTTSVQRKSRWWQGGGFKSSSRPPSIAGESIFSEPEMAMPGTWDRSMAGIGSGTGSLAARRAPRSDYGPTSHSLGKAAGGAYMPPLPKHDPAALRAMSSSSSSAGGRGLSAAPPGRLHSGVAPLGAKSPSLQQMPTASPSSKQRLNKMSTFSDSNLAKAGQRSSAQPGASSSADWKAFINSMQGSDTSKAWGGQAPVTIGAAGKAPVQRRKSVVDRVKKELEQDAQFEQVQRDPGVVHQDLLARAAQQVVGMPPPGSTEAAAAAPPLDIRPGSLVGSAALIMGASPTTASFPEPRHTSPVITTSELDPHPARSPSRASMDRDLPPTPAEAAIQQQQEDDQDDDEEEEQTESEESSDEDQRPALMLDVVAEEDEETSSAGHEMRPQPPRVTSPTPHRHRAFDAALRRTSFDPPNKSSPPNRTAALHAAKGTAPAIALTGADVRVDAKGKAKMPESETEGDSSDDDEEENDDDESSTEEEAKSTENTSAPAKPSATASPPVPAKAALAPTDSDASDSDAETDVGAKAASSSRPSMLSVGRQDSDSRSLASKSVAFQGQDGKDGDDDSDAASDATSLAGASQSIRSSRPPTLQRRLSDLSLGGSLAISAILRGAGAGTVSRSSSSRRMRLNDDDSDSASGGAASDDDADLRARAAAEQERLRSIKVGEDFFGGELSTILDRFNKTNWSDSTVDRLRAQASTSSASLSVKVSDEPQEVLGPADQAQKTLDQIRQSRAERLAILTSIKGKEGATTTTTTDDGQSIISGLAPSFAATWLLNQGAESDVAAAAALVLAEPSAPGASAPAPGAAPATPEAAKVSVLNRPRGTAHKAPTQMGGVEIAHGKLPAQAPPIAAPVDNRSTLPLSIIPARTSSTTGASVVPDRASSQEIARQTSASPTRLPEAGKTTAVLATTASKDKPAPLKSAMKPKTLRHSKSLADTLFGFSSRGSSSSSPAAKEDKKKAKKGRSGSVGSSDKGSAAAAVAEAAPAAKAPPSAWGARKEKKVAKLEKKQQLAVAVAVPAPAPGPAKAAPVAVAAPAPAPVPAPTAVVPAPGAVDRSRLHLDFAPDSSQPSGVSRSESTSSRTSGILSPSRDEEWHSASEGTTPLRAEGNASASYFSSPTKKGSSSTTDEARQPGSTPASPTSKGPVASLASSAAAAVAGIAVAASGPFALMGAAGDDEDKAKAKVTEAYPTADEKIAEQGGGKAERITSIGSFSNFDLPNFSLPTSSSKDSVKAVGAEPEEERDDDDEKSVSETVPETVDEEPEEELAATADTSAKATSIDAAAPAPVRSPPPVSELGWSGESAASTVLSTPTASEVLSPLAARRSASVTPGEAGVSPMVAGAQDKKLPMPPAPSFDDCVEMPLPPHSDMTPMADARHQPTFAAAAAAYDSARTPLAVQRPEPSFGGINLIPPTPPALESRPSFGAAQAPAAHVSTLREADDDEEAEAASDVPQAPALNRTASSRSKTPTDGTRKLDSGASLTRSTSSSGSVRRKSGVPQAQQEYSGKGLSLPPGLVATTVASSSSSQTLSRSDSTEEGLRRKKTKSKKSSAASEPAAAATAAAVDGVKKKRSSQSAVGKSTSSRSLAADAPPVPHLPSDIASLRRGSAPSSVATSDGGLSIPSRSNSVSPAPSPAGSVSGRSGSVVSSASYVSGGSSESGGPSRLYAQPAYPRKIRTLSAGPGGQARTQVMSAISEWESTPLSERPASPFNQTGMRSSPNSTTSHSPVNPQPDSLMPPPGMMLPGSATRSDSSMGTHLSPSFVREAPIGASTETYLHTPVPRSRRSVDMGRPTSMMQDPVGRAMSVDGHSAYNLYPESIASGVTPPSASMSATSLPAVPMSSYRPKDPKRVSGTIDDRLYARTTMNTMAVSNGAFLNRVKSTTSKSARRASMDSSRNSIEAETLREELGKTQMSLTAHTPPPRKITSTQVLVQVIAVAIDETDRLILREKVRSDNAYGFVPGRSFCGRIMEAGWEVKHLRKGDVVFGLQEARKCGALAEFMALSQDLVAKAPEDCLTTEQIAALPATGVLAYQIMQNHCSELPRGARVLILNAHDGIGLLTLQECAGLGLIIVGQCPPSASEGGLAICEANGAHEVVVGEPLWAINSLHEGSFDLVVDTIGGRRLYDASRRILAEGGHFVTCYGDEHTATANPNLKSHLRSLRRSFFKKDKKNIGYEWLGSDTGDCREALAAVREAAQNGDIVPRLSSILPFADAARAFDPVIHSTEAEPGAVVIRVS